jgi:hypothetical protein
VKNHSSDGAQGNVGNSVWPGLQRALAQYDDAADHMRSASSSEQSQIVILHRPGRLWRGANADYLDLQGFAAHTEHYRALAVRGLLVAGGPFLNGGGCMIVSGEAGLEEMTRFALDDPAVKSGLLDVDVHVWLPVLKPSRNPVD